MLLALTGPQARLMIAIWKLQAKNPPALHITTALLAKVTRQKQPAVAQTIRRIQERRPDKQYFIVTGLPQSGHGGRPRNSYHLNVRVVVTFPITALALLELASRGSSQFAIRRSQFVSSVAQKYGLSPISLRERLIDAISAGYIEVPGKGHIWPAALIESEAPYLTLLAKEFKMQRSEQLALKTPRRGQ